MDTTKILITGTHSTGKSTLLNELKTLERFKDFKFIGGVTRDAKSLGFNINEEGDLFTQLYCMSRDFLNIVENKQYNVIYDRSIIDTLVYSLYLYDKLPPWVIDTIRHMCETLMKNFDLIIWLRPEQEISDDSVRSMNKEFQTEVDYMFGRFFKLHNLPVFQLSGNITERIDQFCKLLDKK